MNNETPLAQGQVDVDVRAQFEDWFYDGFAGSLRRNRDGEYEYMPAHVAWITWQAAFKAGREAQGWIDACDVAEATKGMEVEIDQQWIEQRKKKLLEELAELDA